MAIALGGVSYIWRGRAVSNIRGTNNYSWASMPRADSTIFSPCSVVPGVTYEVTITASNKSGNGTIVTNFYAGKEYDGNQVIIPVNNSATKEYVVSLTVPQAPHGRPIYFRIWRPARVAGCAIIQEVRIEGPEDNNCDTHIRAEVNKLIKIEYLPKVSIITPTRNNFEVLKKCCEALVANTHYPNWEWIIGDSASTDGTAEYIKGLNDDRIKFVERGTTEGSYSSINNELVKLSTGEFLLFLNDDTEPQPFWLLQMVIKMCRDPQVGVVGARLEYSPGVIQHAGIAFVSAGPINIGHQVLQSCAKGFADHDRYLQAVTGACMLIRKKDFEDVGGFDPVYYFCYEDVALCLIISKQLNKKVLYAANAVLLHSESVSQKKYNTGGERQGIGVKAFKEKWMPRVEIDFVEYCRDINKNKADIDISFVTCVNNINQYSEYVISSLIRNVTCKNYDIVPILNMGNPYSAAQALNIGIDKSRSDLVVLLHQDVGLLECWIDTLYDRIKEIETKTTDRWGILGTAGIDQFDDTIGMVYCEDGVGLQWSQPPAHKKRTICQMQTLDEHCLIMKKSSGLRFDEKRFDGFHFYGGDISLSAIDQGFKNYGILCPLIHVSTGSLVSGKKEFMRLMNVLAEKWKKRFRVIRTTTSVIKNGVGTTYVNFKE